MSGQCISKMKLISHAAFVTALFAPVAQAMGKDENGKHLGVLNV